MDRNEYEQTMKSAELLIKVGSLKPALTDPEMLKEDMIHYPFGRGYELVSFARLLILSGDTSEKAKELYRSFRKEYPATESPCEDEFEELLQSL